MAMNTGVSGSGNEWSNRKTMNEGSSYGGNCVGPGGKDNEHEGECSG